MGRYFCEKIVTHVFSQIDELIAMPSIAKFTSQPGIQIYPLDKKNVLFFLVDGDSLVLPSIYPYKMDIGKSKYY